MEKLSKVSTLNKILIRKYQSESQGRALKNIKILYKAWETIIELFDDNSTIVSEAKYKTIQGEGTKILTP